MNIKKQALVFLQAFAGAYAVITGAVLPLYMKDGLVQIGDAKYFFYRNMTVLFLILSVCGMTAFLLGGIRGHKRAETIKIKSWSVVDYFVLIYGISTVLSWLLSSFRARALFGYMDWHMGLVTQLLLVWSYFFLSRFYSQSKTVWIIMGVASMAVLFVGMMNRYQFDVLGVFSQMDYWEWNRLNLLSTIGNINWYAGYLCLTLPFLVYLFFAGKGLKRAVGGIGSFIGFASLFTQGSMAGYAGVAASFMVLLWFSLANCRRIARFMEILLLFSAAPVLIMGSIPFAPRGLQLPESAVTEWKGWSFLFLLFLVIYTAVRWRTGRPCAGERGNVSESASLGNTLQQNVPEDPARTGKFRRYYVYGILGSILTGIFLFVIYQYSESFRQLLGDSPALRFNNEWGSGRGALWKVSVRSFLEGDWKQRIFGAGPDCFAPVIYENYDLQNMLHVSGQWEGAVFANAHNEWLNMLVTGGLLGAVSYAGIFISGFYRFSKKADSHPVLVLGMMALGGYCVYNIFSFQQIITTPIAFLILGMLESYCREGIGQTKKYTEHNAGGRK